MLKETVIILLLIALIYYYRQAQKPLTFTGASSKNELQTQLDQIRNKLGSKTLDELMEENSDWETEVDTLTRTKNSLEADLLAQSNAFQNRLREKDREIKKLKEDLGNEKQMGKGSLERITKLTEQIQNLEQEIKDSAEQKRELEEKVKNMPGEFPEADPNLQSADLLTEFKNWIAEKEENQAIMSGVDWNFYQDKKDWLTSFKKWNALRTDRLEVLEEWLESKK